MKSIHFFIISFSIFLFNACSIKEKTSVSLPELMQAEAIMYEHPDSALHLLQNMEIPNASQKLEHATWALLMTQAKYKMRINQSDSLINVAYDYFMKQKDAQRKALVLYSKGGICYSNKEIEEAQNFFLEANDYVEKTNDKQLGYLINAQLGSIYVFRSYKEYALKAFNKAHLYAVQSGNSTYIKSSLIYLGRAYSVQKKYEHAIECYEKAIEHAENSHDVKKFITASNELAGVYTEMKEYDKALYHVKQAISKNKIKSITGQINLVIGNIYSKIGQIDSAYYYLTPIVTTEKNPRTINAVCYLL